MKPIIEAEALTECESDQEELLSFLWPGTADGCDCRFLDAAGDFSYTK